MALQPLVTNVRFEHHHDGRGLETATPRISWSFSSENGCQNNWRQHYYEIEVHNLAHALNETYTVNSCNSLLVLWPSKPLGSREHARARVRVYGSPSHSSHLEGPSSDLDWSEWSEWATVEVALLSRGDWAAKLISAPSAITTVNDDGSLKPVRFRKAFEFPGQKVLRARLYITAHGVYQAYINGKPVGDQFMAPGWTSYNHRLQYQVYSVSDHLLIGGMNVIVVELGAGWYASALGWAGGRRCRFGSTLGLMGQLEVDVEGSTQRFFLTTDSSWSCSSSAIIQSEIYNGETFDARLASAVEDTRVNAEIQPFPSARLVSPEAPPVRVTAEISPVNIFNSPAGKTIIDFGQNLVGKLRVNFLRKQAGHVVRFRHAEVMENGELGTRPLRFAKTSDTVISDGNTISGWTPLFTFHGFRYAQVDGWSPEDASNPLTLKSVTALVMHTDMRRTGWFESSHKFINQLHENTVWSMRGNFLSIPTDCPQRDERLGWTGDIQVFSPSANFLYDTSSMLSGWLEDVAVEQLQDGNGIPPFVVPNVIGRDDEGKQDEWWPRVANAVWDDVVIILPWELYRSFGDLRILSKQFESMVVWLEDGVERGTDFLWAEDKWQLGDWLDPLAPPNEPGNGRTDGVLVADVYLVRITQIMARVAGVIGREAESIRYSEQYVRLKTAFQRKYITTGGRISSDSQTALALAFVHELFGSPEQWTAAADWLIRAVRQAQFRVSTGFAGTPIILHALTRIGRPQYAYRMLLEKNCPSWMFPVLMGATTIWERWDSMLPDGSINPGDMTSFNHYALGSVVNWLHETVGGISPIEPGWRKIMVRPIPGADLTHATVRYTSPYGEIRCSWKLEGLRFSLQLIVPPNTLAMVYLPSSQRQSVSGDDKEGLSVGSGQHTFTCDLVEFDTWPLSAMQPIFWPQKPAEAV
ncbi:uncharacterized protein CTRU02_202387 [Colletotrichum truncatum]|uniref:Uncharacterized protein n=1 Tax=Colletotrichum truncatum TaxID=5467 RepID=A0ACC3ZK91_COLTU|nr:uncharacterized protein CTRU02_01548 [Colletotrichum truncatum]KAF6799869.1 hypothetical protein CTRU02_01548 [Colletotrichum truncatum]